MAVFLTVPERPLEATAAAPFLWLFTAFFLVRVAGQLYVRARAPGWLPPTEQWNLMPYRLLLPIQLAILGVMAWICVDFTRGGGVAAEPRETFGEVVVWFSYVYAGAMAVRYVVRMARRPAVRWFGGTIPIVFHLVLASFLYVLGSFHASG